ncbi:molybdopterin synthase sulfurylase [Oleiphilus messinensis]|uniref:Molybdopterin-synthase adenylyltransferase n=1 Tax=Oleiphilus messinensis TaxID=141451 RepID=A0A1Y0I4C4_9GAMM|nr:molybdopterin-synthase adenylyltransferase MoeB [Oleiphilus messinensis]ARU55271.1 molybdopterin synthase sulfurylase [Oleiphilus messinensis]
MIEFSDQDLLRYSRQIMLPAFDIAGQHKLASARVLIVGIGGLGSPVALYLAAAGVGTLVLADHDEVELSNLQRQIVHGEATLNQNKAQSAASRLQDINPGCKVEVLAEKLKSERLEQIVSAVDLVVDASDNFNTRYAINQACIRLKRPLVSGAAIRFEGQVAVFDFADDESPCYACLYPDLGEEQLTCSESGILAPVVGVIGSMQALETIKMIAGVGTPLVGKLLLFDGLNADWRTMRLQRDPQCCQCAGR